MKGLDAFILALPEQFLGHWGYLIVALAAILEVLPFIGSFIPGQTIVILAGFFAKLHILNPIRVIIFAVIGAILGDMLSYYLGKKYGYSLIIKYGKYIALKKSHYEKLKNLILNHTGKTLILGRFNPFSRSFAPFIAGASEVGLRKFLTYTIMGSLVWGVGSVIIGLIFGASYEVAAKHIGRFVAIATILAILLILLYRVINRKHNIFKKYHIWIFLTNLFSLYIVAKLIDDVHAKEGFISRWDILTSTQIHLLWTPFWNNFMTITTNIFTTIVMLALITAIIIYLAIKREWHKTTLLFLATGTACLTDLIIEIFMHRSRPEFSIINAAGYSFPSGHAVLATLLFGFIIIYFRNKIKDEANRAIFVVIFVLLGLFVAFSRIYLNVHWLSDVIAGVSISVFWMTFWVLFIRFAKAIKKFIKDQIDKYAKLRLLSR